MKKLHKLALSSAVSIVALTGAAFAEAPTGFIVDGVPGDIAQIPWQVALIDGQSVFRRQFCGGSIVADNWILTAAHCVENAHQSGVDVLAGTARLSLGGQRVDVAEIRIHPKWGTTGVPIDYDAALLRLAEPLSVGSPIDLADDTTPLPDGMGLNVSGWGRVFEGGPSSDELLYVSVPIYNQADCVDDVGDGVTDQMICAGLRAGGKDSCNGDSGGPLYTIENNPEDAILAGIVSWGIGCARPDFPGVYTRVSAVSDWVAQVTSGN